MSAAGLMDALSLCARTGIRASGPLQEMCTGGIAFISRIFAAPAGDGAHRERVAEIVRDTVIDDYFKRKKCKLSLKAITSLLLACPGIAGPAVGAVAEYCVSAGNEVKCGDARRLMLALAESKDASYAAAVRSGATKRSLGAAIARILGVDYKKRDRAVAAAQWAARVLQRVVGTGAGGEDDRAFLDAMPAVVSLLDDPSAKVNRAAEQCAFWILSLHSQGARALLARRSPPRRWRRRARGPSAADALGASPLAADMARANAWIASGGGGVTADRLAQIMVRYTKMYGTAGKGKRKGKKLEGKREKKKRKVGAQKGSKNGPVGDTRA